MPDFRLPYGKTHLEFSLPDAWAPELIAPRDVPGAADPLAEVERALTSPLPPALLPSPELQFSSGEGRRVAGGRGAG